MVHLRSKKIRAFTLLSYLKHLLTNLLCSLGVHFPSQPADHCWSGTVRQKVLPVCVGLLLAFSHFFFSWTPSFWESWVFNNSFFFWNAKRPVFPVWIIYMQKKNAWADFWLVVLWHVSLLTGGFRMCNFCLVQILSKFTGSMYHLQLPDSGLLTAKTNNKIKCI